MRTGPGARLHCVRRPSGVLVAQHRVRRAGRRRTEAARGVVSQRRTYGEAARFATVVAKVVAQHLGCWNEEDFKRLAEQVK